ncbi:MAG: iron-containing alcohol dehydrogenase [Candidatus Aminicenantes bacterium]|nr:MAG: iron-containing alcohol dehydrogenase [Candidatus Aminicenantes bacterium]
MEELKEKARELIDEFKGSNYIYGIDCLERSGKLAAAFGRKILLMTNLQNRDKQNFEKIVDSLSHSGLEIIGPIKSSRPNSPKEDVLKLKKEILEAGADCVIVASGGSGIDAAKAACVLAALGGDIEDYFGVGKVSERLGELGKNLLPCIAIQTASSSAAHLTKYSNITDLEDYQKKLIIDEAIVPPAAFFDYSLTKSMSASFTSDGAFDGLAHSLEGYYGAGSESFQKIQEIALTGIELIVASIEKAVNKPSDMEAREALGLATDLGGYSIMVGGTNGAHLTSFSLVDILSHGRACALLNPYYTVFFAPAIQEQLKQLAGLFFKHNLVERNSLNLSGRDLGLAVAKALSNLGKRVGIPTTLGEISGMSKAHINKALEAAKNPQLESKLKNMPIPLSPDMIDHYMKPVLEAALEGDFSLIKTI